MKLPHLLSFATALFVSAVPSANATRTLSPGAPVPAVAVRTDTGATVDLREALAAKPTVLIFYRGGWCPYCTRHLSALGEAETALREAGFQLFALSPDRPEKLRTKPTHENLQYTLLSDSEMNAARSFGIAFKVEDALVAKYKSEYGIDLEGDSGQTHHLLPHPAVFIVDQAGIIRFAHVNADYKVRLTPDEIMTAAKSALNPRK
jgi:peroxiredoxin